MQHAMDNAGRSQQRLRVGKSAKGVAGVTHIYPLALAVGAAVFSAGLGWVIPSGKRERKLLAGTALTLAPIVRFAVAAASEAGKRKADELARNAFAMVGQGLLAAVATEPATSATS